VAIATPANILVNYSSIFNTNIGQFMKRGMDIDTQREMLIYSDGRDPVPVTRDSVMTGKWCWKVKNFGHQGEGLIEGDILDYVMPSILDVSNNLRKITNI